MSAALGKLAVWLACLLAGAAPVFLGTVALVTREVEEARRAPPDELRRDAHGEDLARSAFDWLDRARLGADVNARPEVRDGLLALDDDARDVDEVQRWLDERRAAHHPDGVGTIVLIHRRVVERVRVADVELVDVVEGVVIGRRTFRGERPAAGIELGPAPDASIAAWVEALPVR